MLFINNKLHQVDKIAKKIEALSKKKVDEKDSYKIEMENRRLHMMISKILFASAKEHNYNVISRIVRNNYIRADMVFDERHLDIVQYSLLESDNELFKFLYYKQYKYISSYFNNIPSFFVLLMNKKNFELIELFLTEERFFSEIRKESICICFYLAVQEAKRKIIDIILSNKTLEVEIEGKDIQSIIIYSISHKQYDRLAEVFSHEILTNKLSDEYVQNILALILLNKDIDSLDIVIDSEVFLRFILSRKQILNNIAVFAYSNEDIQVLNTILKNKKRIEEESSKNEEEFKEKFKKNVMIEDSL